MAIGRSSFGWSRSAAYYATPLGDRLTQKTRNRADTERGRSNPREVSELSTTNLLLKEQTKTLAEDKEKLISENEELEKQQKKLQQEINKMVQSKEVMERNIHAYDENTKWQLLEPSTLMSAKAYHDKKVLPLVEKLKDIVKNLIIKCIQLTEQCKKLTTKVDGQQKQINCLTDKVIEQCDTIDILQEKASDLERHIGREQVQLIVEQSKVLEQAEKVIKRSERAFEMSRQGRGLIRMTDMEKKVMVWLCAKIVAETDLYETDKEVQNLINWVCLSEQIKENNNTIPNLTGEYKKIELDCREGVQAQLDRMKELCKERNSLYEKQNDLKGQEWKIEKSLER